MDDVNDLAKRLTALLKQHNATLHSTCQTGCDIELRVDGKTVGEFDFYPPGTVTFRQEP